MKTFKFKNNNYNVPTVWDEVTLKQQVEVSKIASKEQHIKQIALVAAYTGIDIHELKKTNIKELQPLFNLIKFVSEELPTEPIERFEYKGEEYNITDTLLNAEFQDFISLENIVKEYGDKEYEALPLMVAILAKKDGESLDDYDIMERAKHFEDLPITIANRLKVFFYLLVNQSSINSDVYSNLNEVILKRINECKDTMKKQGGKGLRTRLYNGTLLKYTTYIEKGWNKYYTSLQSKK